MPHLPVIPNIFRVAIRHVAPSTGQHTVNVIHVLGRDDDTGASLASALNDAIADTHPFEALQSGYDSDHVTLQITPLDGHTTTTEHTVSDSAWGGGVGGDAIPEAAMGVTLYTDVRGRRGRGRVFVGPVSESSVNNGLFGSTLVSDMTAAWNLWQVHLKSLDVNRDFMVASYKDGLARPVTVMTARAQVRTQRGRLVRLRT